MDLSRFHHYHHHKKIKKLYQKSSVNLFKPSKNEKKLKNPSTAVIKPFAL
jgi:hypothetical protein